MRVTTQSRSGCRTVHEVPGTLQDVGRALAQTTDGQAYFFPPDGIGFVIRVAEIVGVEQVGIVPPPVPKKADLPSPAAPNDPSPDRVRLLGRGRRARRPSLADCCESTRRGLWLRQRCDAGKGRELEAFRSKKRLMI